MRPDSPGALMYSFSYLEPVCFSMSSSNCWFLTCIQISPAGVGVGVGSPRGLGSAQHRGCAPTPSVWGREPGRSHSTLAGPPRSLGTTHTRLHQWQLSPGPCPSSPREGSRTGRFWKSCGVGRTTVALLENRTCSCDMKGQGWTGSCRSLGARGQGARWSWEFGLGGTLPRRLGAMRSLIELQI